MRLFVAIELDRSAREAVAAEQSRLKKVLGTDRSPLKWVRPEHMHLTLAFLGQVPDQQGLAVAAHLGRPFDEAPFDAGFADLGVFPDRGAPRVLWLGVSGGRAQVMAVQHDVAVRLSVLHVAVEDRAFHPHLTLARWRASREHDRRRVASADRHETIATVPVEAISVIESRLSPAGPEYTVLSRGRLGGEGGSPIQSD
jgi:2'-5' RNA ligase